MKNNGVGLYVHIPFCVRKCNYCDFCSFSDFDKAERNAYLSRLKEEIESYTTEPKIRVDTIFFGGGTPSTLTPGELLSVTDSIKKTFLISSDCEFSLEMNPGTVTREFLSACREAGVNRVSIGLQSIHDNEQKILGRIHNTNDFLQTVEWVKEAGINNFNVDLMYGIPEQTTESFAATLDTVLRLSPTHISAYSLIVEEGTPFYRMRNSLALPSEDEELEMVKTLEEKLSLCDYTHYEISNYAKPGFVCRHNLKYWDYSKYIGVGLCASSFDGENRYMNTDDRKDYISLGAAATRSVETIPLSMRAYEYAMLGLRTSFGISLSDYRLRFGKNFADGKEEKLSAMEKAGYLVWTEDNLKLTEKGFYVSNEILTQIL